MAEHEEDPALIEHMARGIVSAFGHNPDTLVVTGPVLKVGAYFALPAASSEPLWQAYAFAARCALGAYRQYEERKADGARPQ